MSRPYISLVDGHLKYAPDRRERTTLNDDERRQWVANDEGLYNWQRSSRLSMREFIRQHRADIDAHIRGRLSRKPD